MEKKDPSQTPLKGLQETIGALKLPELPAHTKTTPKAEGVTASEPIQSGSQINVPANIESKKAHLVTLSSDGKDLEYIRECIKRDLSINEGLEIPGVTDYDPSDDPEFLEAYLESIQGVIEAMADTRTLFSELVQENGQDPKTTTLNDLTLEQQRKIGITTLNAAGVTERILNEEVDSTFEEIKYQSFKATVRQILAKLNELKERFESVEPKPITPPQGSTVEQVALSSEEKAVIEATKTRLDTQGSFISDSTNKSSTELLEIFKSGTILDIATEWMINLGRSRENIDQYDKIVAIYHMWATIREDGIPKPEYYYQDYQEHFTEEELATESLVRQIQDYIEGQTDPEIVERRNEDLNSTLGESFNKAQKILEPFLKDGTGFGPVQMAEIEVLLDLTPKEVETLGQTDTGRSLLAWQDEILVTAREIYNKNMGEVVSATGQGSTEQIALSPEDREKKKARLKKELEDVNARIKEIKDRLAEIQRTKDLNTTTKS